MTYQWRRVCELWPEPLWRFAIGPGFTSDVIDATGEKIAWSGPVTWFDDATTKSIRFFETLLGAITKAGGSAWTASLQDVSLTAGPVIQPDETQDQTVAIANADAGFVTNGWYTSGNFSADRTVSKGQLLSLVIEYNGAGRLGTDVANFRSLNATAGSAQMRPINAGPALKTAGAWAQINRISNVVFGCADGTYCSFDGAMPTAATDAVAFNSASSPDERGNEFTVPEPIRIGGFWLSTAAAAGADFDVVLYNGTTAVATASHDANALHPAASTGVAASRFWLTSEIELLPGNTYRLMHKPTTANSVTHYGLDPNITGHFQAYGADPTNWLFTSRTDAGAFAATTSRRSEIGLIVTGRLKHRRELVNSAGLIR